MKVDVQTVFAEGKEKWVRGIECSQPFVTGIIDPDWPYTVAPGMKSIAEAKGNGKLSGFTRNRDTEQNQYAQVKPLSIEDMKKLPVGDVIGGYLMMWTVGPFLINGNATTLMKEWGFTPCTILTWAKWDRENDHGYGGVGFWVLGNAEFIIVGKKEGWPSIRTGKSSLLVPETDNLTPETGNLMVAPKGKHSKKPDGLYDFAEQRFPGPFVTLFGRRSRPGWEIVGNESESEMYRGRDIADSLYDILNPVDFSQPCE
jgi:N6-adenosine-specific RNA methylase IME4